MMMLVVESQCVLKHLMETKIALSFELHFENDKLAQIPTLARVWVKSVDLKFHHLPISRSEKTCLLGVNSSVN